MPQSSKGSKRFLKVRIFTFLWVGIDYFLACSLYYGALGHLQRWTLKWTCPLSIWEFVGQFRRWIFTRPHKRYLLFVHLPNHPEQNFHVQHIYSNYEFDSTRKSLMYLTIRIHIQITTCTWLNYKSHSIAWRSLVIYVRTNLVSFLVFGKGTEILTIAHVCVCVCVCVYVCL
jgi:hypothetical protein